MIKNNNKLNCKATYLIIIFLKKLLKIKSEIILENILLNILRITFLNPK